MMSVDVPSLAKRIYAALGPGYSERVYHNAMEVELRKSGVPYETERHVPIKYEGHVIGTLRSDIIIDRRVVLEFKAVAKINDAAITQARIYLEQLDLNEAFVINFAGKEECEIRHVFPSESRSTS